jgi:hypothetical protein
MVDERSLEALRRLRHADESARITLAEFKMLVREQFYMLLLDREAALAAIPKLLPENMGKRRRRQTAQSARCRSVTGHGSDARRQCLQREIPDLRGHAFMPCKAVECHEDRWDLLD